MSFEIPGFTFTLVSSADYTSDQYTAVKVDTSGQAVQCNNAEDCIGVLQNKPNTGQAATVMVNGVTIMEIGTGGLTAGDSVGLDDEGAAVTAAASDAVIGIALETVSATEYGAVLLRGAAKLA